MLQLASPGTAARIRIVQHISTALGETLTDEAIHGLASSMCGTASQLIGAVYELCASFSAAHQVEAGQVHRLTAARAERRPGLPEIIGIVSRYYGLPQKLLKSKSRRRSAVVARATIACLARELTGASYEQIGSALGGRDHTTIMHNCKKMQRDLQNDLVTQQAVDELRRILVGR
jgi:chromosomal replication initiator protein